jgi:hypothetical protein
MLCEAIKNQVVWPVMAMMRSSTMRTRPGPASDNADTGIHPGLLNSRFGYVSISRASREATLFTDDMPSSAPSSATMPQKTSAVAINRAPSIAQGVGMGN